MRRKIVTWLLPAVLLLVPACALAATSRTAASHAKKPPAVQVSPVVGTTRTHFKVSFKSVASPQHDFSGVGEHYWVSVSGPEHAGCVGTALTTVPADTRGTRETAHVVPQGGSWCRGTYHGRVEMVDIPICPRGTACPMFVAIVGTVGRFSFRVK